MHAVVDTAVTIANSDRRTRNASGLVNAILRKAARQKAPALDAGGDDLANLALKYSHPRWMAEKFVATFGRADAEEIMTADNEAAPTAIRMNPSRGTREEICSRIDADGIEVASEGRFPETLIIRGSPHFDASSFRDGFFSVQSEASQIVARMLAPARGATVVDCAAAPGGKATHLAEMIGERGRVIALDLNFAGLRKSRALAERLGHENLMYARADFARDAPLRPGSFDYVLLDAPCTGTGTLRQHPEIRWRLKPSDPSRMAVIQLAMLRNAAALLRPGGAMVYSVCSLMREEGAAVVADFLAADKNYRLDPHPPANEKIADLIREDGFFAARIVRAK
jgi:16S rRNA (cytosine967-C5)-methyltransferase